MKSYVVIAIICALLLVLVQSTAVQAHGGYLVVIGDSCGYEVAQAILEKYGYPARIAPYTWVTEIPSNTILVVMFTNVTPREAFNHVVDLLENTGSSIIVTDTFHEYITSRTLVSILSTISSEDMWLYCVHRDESALARVERALRVRTIQPLNIPLVAAIAFLATVASLQVQPRARERTLATLKKLVTLLTGFFALFHMKIRREDIFSHPVRLEILRVLQSRGEVSFSELQKEVGCSRATLEWHISLLIRARVIEELKVGKKRVFRLNSYSPVPRLVTSKGNQKISSKNSRST